jgi:hypothetical protein
MVTLPTAEELNPFDDLDGRVACRHFLGKSLAEAEALFRENEIYYQEDLMWMGAKAFCFYVQAAMNYVRRERTKPAAFLAHLTSTLEFRIEADVDGLRPVARPLLEFLEEMLLPGHFSDEAVGNDPGLREQMRQVQAALAGLERR